MWGELAPPTAPKSACAMVDRITRCRSKSPPQMRRRTGPVTGPKTAGSRPGVDAAGDHRRAVLAGHGPAGEPAGQAVVARHLHGPVRVQPEPDQPARHPDGRDLDPDGGD